MYTCFLSYGQPRYVEVRHFTSPSSCAQVQVSSRANIGSKFPAIFGVMAVSITAHFIAGSGKRNHLSLICSGEIWLLSRKLILREMDGMQSADHGILYLDLAKLAV